jgi:hypothetical protein
MLSVHPEYSLLGFTPDLLYSPKEKRPKAKDR